MSTACQPAFISGERIIGIIIDRDEARLIAIQMFFSIRDTFPAFLLSVCFETFGVLKGSPAYDISVFDSSVYDLADVPCLPGSRLFESVSQCFQVSRRDVVFDSFPSISRKKMS